ARDDRPCPPCRATRSIGRRGAEGSPRSRRFAHSRRGMAAASLLPQRSNAFLWRAPCEPFALMKIADLMTHNPELCTPQSSVIDAAHIMARHNVGIVPIVESVETRQAIGCLTDRDIVVRVVAEGKDPRAVSVGQVMTEELVTCTPEDDVDRVRRRMESKKVRRVLVLDEHGSLLGIVATADLATSVEAEKVGETLEQISQP